MIYEAANGPDGLLLAASERPDVICLDLGLPGLDGREVLRRLKDDPATRDIPVVVVTSRALDDAERGELLALASGVLSKDAISRERALAAVDDALRGAGRDA